MYPDVSKCIQTYLMCPERSCETPGVKCIQMYPNVSECIRMYPNVSKLICMWFKRLQTYPDVEMYPNVSECIQSYPDVQSYSVGSCSN